MNVFSTTIHFSYDFIAFKDSKSYIVMFIFYAYIYVYIDSIHTCLRM